MIIFHKCFSLLDSHEIESVKQRLTHNTTVDSTSSSICRQSSSASLQWTTSGSCISRAILICLMNTSFCWAAYWPWLHTQQSYWHTQQRGWPWLHTHEGLTMVTHTQQRSWPWLILGNLSRECPVTGAVGPHHAFFMPVKQRGIITGLHSPDKERITDPREGLTQLRQRKTKY